MASQTSGKTQVLLLLALTLATHASAQLQLYAARATTPTVIVLKDGDKICPADFDRGFTIRCLEATGDRRATFKVDGVFVRTEVRIPFFIRGDRDGISYPWRDFPTQREFTVECQTDHSVVHVTLSIACPGGSTVPEAPKVPQMPMIGPETPMKPSTGDSPGLYFRSLSKPTEGGVPVVDGVSICPERDLGSSQFTLACVSARQMNSALFSIDDVQVRVEKKAPFLIAGDRNGMAYPWRKNIPKEPFSVRCDLGDGSYYMAKDVLIACDEVVTTMPPTTTVETTTTETASATVVTTVTTVPPATTTTVGTTEAPMTTEVTTMPATTTTTGTKAEQCIIIPAKGAKLSEGWTETSDGVGFKLGDRSKKLTPAGESELIYSFRAGVTGRHAVVLDMTTGGKVDYNDVWIRLMPGGFMLSRRGATKFESGWIKAYHNLNKRVALSNSVDFLGHSISTGAVLKKGDMYEFAVSGRSHNVIVHRVLLFPCDGVGCERRSWKVVQEQCVPGSTDYYD